MSLLRKSGLLKNRFFQIIMAMEVLCFFLLTVNLFGKNHIIPIEMFPLSSDAWTYREDLGGWYAEESTGAGNLVLGDIALKAGVYRMQLHYQTDTDLSNMCTAEDDTVSYGGLLTNGSELYAGKNSTDYEIWLKEPTESLRVKVSFNGSGSILVTGLTICETNAMERITLFLAVCLFVSIDSLWIYSVYWKRVESGDRGKRRENAQRKNAGLILGLTIFASSLPLMVDYVIGGGDIIFHMMRIEGIKDGLLSGQFPVRVAPEWLWGHGYASSVFYGDTLLYVAAFFRLIGFTVQDSYKLFLFLMNIATCMISYECFKWIFQSRYLGALCSALYTLSIYRIYVLYCRAAVGEAEGLMFLPLIAYGFYRVYTEDPKEKSYKNAWIPLTVGYCGLIQSHLLSCELVGGGFCPLLPRIMEKNFLQTDIYGIAESNSAFRSHQSLVFGAIS